MLYAGVQGRKPCEYFRLIVGNIVDDRGHLEGVIGIEGVIIVGAIVMGDNRRHFPYFPTRNSVKMLEEKQSGDCLSVVVEPSTLEHGVDEKRGYWELHNLASSAGAIQSFQASRNLNICSHLTGQPSTIRPHVHFRHTKPRQRKRDCITKFFLLL